MRPMTHTHEGSQTTRQTLLLGTDRNMLNDGNHKGTLLQQFSYTKGLIMMKQVWRINLT